MPGLTQFGTCSIFWNLSPIVSAQNTDFMKLTATNAHTIPKSICAGNSI